MEWPLTPVLLDWLESAMLGLLEGVVVLRGVVGALVKTLFHGLFTALLETLTHFEILIHQINYYAILQ